MTALIWTTLVWALIFGWTGARVIWHILSRDDYRGMR